MRMLWRYLVWRCAGGQPPVGATAEGKLPPMTTATVEGIPVGHEIPAAAGKPPQGTQGASNLPSYMQGGPAPSGEKPPPGYPTI